MVKLIWPEESARTAPGEEPRFAQSCSNICLDFHGDPAHAQLVVFSDGNHHMALEDALRAFVGMHPDAGEIFYTTTPPRVALQMLRAGCLHIGNLRLAMTPHVFISPPQLLDSLVAEGRMTAHMPFMRCRGIVLLVKKDNPKHITGVADLLRDDVRLFLSNPITEKVSNQIYTECLRRLGMQHGLALDFLAHAPGQPNPNKLIYGEAIHHREAPQAVVDGQADVALVFYHLALRYQRIFPEHFDFVWPEGSVGEQPCDISYFNAGLIGDGGVWGKLLLDFLLSDTVSQIYQSHGLLPAKP